MSKTEKTRSTVAGGSKVEPAQNEKPSDVENDWHPGDLVWAQMGRYPFWPGLVIVDPNKEKYCETKKIGQTSQCLFHVQFFGDNGSHSWVSANRIIQYEGKDKFLKFAETKKKDKKYASAFPRPGKNPKWDFSVREAEEGASKSRNERLYFFDEYYPIYINENKKTDKKTVKKTKNKTVAEDKRKKSSARKSSSPGNSSRNSEDDEPVAETSPVIPEKDSPNKAKSLKRRHVPGGAKENSKSENSSSKRVRKHKREKKFVGQFEVFVDRCAHLFARGNPDLQDDEAKCRRFMAAMWTSMTEEEKSRYHGSYEAKYAALEK